LTVEKTALERHFISIELRGAPISVKVSLSEGRIMQVSPEFDEVYALGESIGVPTRVLMDEARVAASDRGLAYGAEFSG
jgi:uncharacterized protein (DUF111 family)